MHNVATVDTGPEKGEMQKSVQELLFVFSRHRLVCRRAIVRKAVVVTVHVMRPKPRLM